MSPFRGTIGKCGGKIHSQPFKFFSWPGPRNPIKGKRFVLFAV
jgi:hypothetical protein